MEFTSVIKEMNVFLINRLFIIAVFFASMLGILIPRQLTLAQDFQSFKAGVVRIQNKKRNEVGAGFIIKVEKDRTYIITAAHVVRGNEYPEVFFLNSPNDPVQGDLIDREDDDQKGLALIVVKPDRETLKSLITLKLGSPLVKGGEAVSVIGFPDGTEFWSVTPASISRLEGRSLVFSGPIRRGNSGGPVLLNGQVIGLVTDTVQESAYAVRAKNISVYAEGIPQLGDLLDTEARPPTKPGSAENLKFCQALIQIVDASQANFSAIINHKASSYADVFESLINLPGTYTGTIHFKAKYFVAISKGDDKSDTEYYKLVSKVKACQPEWREVPSTETSNSNYSTEANNTLHSKSHRFVTDRNVTVEINSHKSPSFDSFYTDVKVYAPDSERSATYLGGKRSLSALEIVTDDSKAKEICEKTLKLIEASHSDFYSIVKPGPTPRSFASTIDLPLFPMAEVRPREQAKFYTSAQESEIEVVYYRLVDIVRRCVAKWRVEEGSNAVSNDERSFSFFEGNPGTIIEIRLGQRHGLLYFTVYSPNSAKFRN